MNAAAATRDYDVLLYGAGGFTGRQTVAYFASHAPATLRWAIAGPRRHTLEAARDYAGARLNDRDLIVAPSQQQALVDAVVARSRVVLSTAGPFALYGTPIVDACVRFGTHYVDITGETPWMRQIAQRYHEPAAANATRIIPCCGFDSVPSDLGVLLTARAVGNTPGAECVEVRAYFQFRGGLNGGTVASLLNMLNTPRDAGETAARASRDRRVRMIKGPQRDERLGTWIGPFVMAPTNTQVVRRSMMLDEASYGPRLIYQESMRYDGTLAAAKAITAAAGYGALFAALKRPATRKLLTPLLPKPGTGPSTRTMDAGWFTCDLIGIAADGRELRGLIRHPGDPGNRATTVFVCESALALALDEPSLPATYRGGVLTPAVGLGDALVKRLRAAGTIIDVPASHDHRRAVSHGKASSAGDSQVAAGTP